MYTLYKLPKSCAIYKSQIFLGMFLFDPGDIRHMLLRRGGFFFSPPRPFTVRDILSSDLMVDNLVVFYFLPGGLKTKEEPETS